MCRVDGVPGRQEPFRRLGRYFRGMDIQSDRFGGPNYTHNLGEDRSEKIRLLPTDAPDDKQDNAKNSEEP